MKYLKSYSLFERIQSREELRNPESESFIDPALFTQEEYLKITNPSEKHHDSSAYNFSLGEGGYETSEKIRTYQLVRQKTINKIRINFYVKKRETEYGYFKDSVNNTDYQLYTEQEKKEKNLPLYDYTVYAIHDTEDLIVGGGQDEWGCVLIWTVKEYRGLGIGEEIVKIYRSYYPSKDSGGFTVFGYNQIKKYHAFLVRRYMQNGIYSDMVKNGEMTKEKAEAIISSVKDVKRFSKETSNPLAEYYGDIELKLYIGSNYVVIYDAKILKKNELSLDYDIEDLVYGKVIKCYISVRENEGGFMDILMMYGTDKKMFEYALSIICSMFPEGVSNRFFLSDKARYGMKEIEWMDEYVDNGIFSKEEYELYKDVEYYDIYKIKKPYSRLKELQHETQKELKKIDPYEEGFNIMIEKAEEVWYEYAQQNIADFYLKKGIEKVDEYADKNPDYLLKMQPYHYDNYFRSFIGDRNLDILDDSYVKSVIVKGIDYLSKVIRDMKD